MILWVLTRRSELNVVFSVLDFLLCVMSLVCTCLAEFNVTLNIEMTSGRGWSLRIVVISTTIISQCDVNPWRNYTNLLMIGQINLFNSNLRSAMKSWFSSKANRRSGNMVLNILLYELCLSHTTMDSTYHAEVLFVLLLSKELGPGCFVNMSLMLALSLVDLICILLLIGDILIECPLLYLFIIGLDISISKILKDTGTSLCNNWSSNRSKWVSFNRDILDLFVETKHVWKLLQVVVDDNELS